jgi:hypothetical protein
MYNTDKERTNSYGLALKGIDQKYHHARVLCTATRSVFLKKKRTQTLSFPIPNEFHSQYQLQNNTEQLRLQWVFNSQTRFHAKYFLLIQSSAESWLDFRPFTCKCNQITHGDA